MKKVAFIIEAKGPAADDLKHVLSLIKGAAAPGYAREMADIGLERHSVWIGRRGETTLFVVTAEGDDAAAAVQRFQTSDNPVAKWVRENIEAKTDFRYSTMEPLELGYDWSLEYPATGQAPA